MKHLVLLLGLTGSVVPRLGAQSSTQDLLQQASEFYEHLDVERALPLLRQIVSPNWPFEVTAAQRVDAYKYLGACLALVGKRDSATLYFRAAIERDPFADLDPAVFTPAQLRLFGEARRLTFAVAVRPVAPARIDPRTERLTFAVVTTHAGSVDIAVRPVSSDSALSLFRGVNDGPREVAWDGLLADRHLAPPGRYELRVTGSSQLLRRADSAVIYFEIRHEVAPLEDTLPELTARDLLPEQFSTSAATRDLLKGLVVAGAALLISDVLASRHLGGSLKPGSAVIAGTAVVTGAVAFAGDRRHPDIPGNIVVNAQRRAERAGQNAAIKGRNTAKTAATVLLVSPAAGVGP